MSAALLTMGFMVQACGSGSSSGAAAASSAATSYCSVNAYGQQICTSSTATATTTNATLYNACASLYEGEQSGYNVSAASYVYAADGAYTCQVTIQQEIEYDSSRLFLGPNYPQYGLSYAGNTGITVSPWDNLVTSGIGGSESSGTFANCQSGGNSIAGIAYGYVQGTNYFELSTATAQNPVIIPENGGGNLYVGLNQSEGGGCLAMAGYIEIVRCVDSSGTAHPCTAADENAI